MEFEHFIQAYACRISNISLYCLLICLKTCKHAVILRKAKELNTRHFTFMPSLCCTAYICIDLLQFDKKALFVNCADSFV